MRYRKLDPITGFRVFGHGIADFYVDVPEAVVQAVKTRLGLFTADWKLDTSAGMPWRTQVLGKFTGPTRDPVIQARILGTPGIVDFVNYSSSIDRDPRHFSVSFTCDTIYGSQIPTTINAVNPLPLTDVRYGR